MALSHIVLRRREPGLPRPYRTPGGIADLVRRLRPGLLGAGGDVPGGQGRGFIALGVYAVALAYFAFYSRHHLVAAAPEEEFAALAAAEAELERN